MNRFIRLTVHILAILILLSISCSKDSSTGPENNAPPVITFVPIPGGTFQMGDVEDVGYNEEEKPVHTVTLSSFEMSIYEVTNAQYAEYLNEALASGDIEIQSGDVYSITDSLRYLDIGHVHNSYNKCWIQYDSGVFTVTPGKENWPVVAVTWYGAKSFAQYYDFDLPTEAEWEYAARGGKQYKYGTDDGTLDSSKANYRGIIGSPVDVGSYPANPFGLYDMTGNVMEWCNDWYGEYTSGSVTNPTGAQTGEKRVLRSGRWTNNSLSSRSAHRYGFYPWFTAGSYSFRVVRRP